MRPTMCGLALILAGACLAGESPAVAVWDPGASVDGARFTIDAGQLEQVAAWIGEAGLPTLRLSSARLEQEAIDPARVAVLVLPGDTVPRSSITALAAFAAQGGVLIGLSARVPFNNAIAPGKGVAWELSPGEPRFAWETHELRDALGIRYIYNPALHDQGIRHAPTALFKRYLPDAPVVEGRLPHAWLCSLGGGGPATRFIPLVDSRRADGAAVVPAIYLAVFGKRVSIMCSQPGWCGVRPAAWWSRSRETVQALARLGLDLAQGRIDLTQEPAVELVADPLPPEPLSLRPAGRGVDPDGAVPVARFGVFDGSSCGLAEPVPAGGTVTVAAGAAMPRGLLPGARMMLPLPELGGEPAWLRIRFAFTASGAALAALIGQQPLLAEQFTCHEAGGASNNAVNANAQPSETNRIVCIPPGAEGALELSNPGRQPVWFDAVQVERRPRGTPGVLVGFNASMGMTQPGGTFTVPTGIGRGWGAVRQTLRLQHLGEPGDPGRWAKVDQVLAQAETTGAPVHAILEGCPRWLATPASYAEAVRRKRPHICVPSLEAWTAMLEELVPRYRDRVAAWELWNEVDISQFWIGTPQEYVALWQATLPVLRRLDPGKPVFTGGLAMQSEEMIDAFVAGGLTAEATWIANHCYAGQSPMWEQGNGRLEGMLYARGVATPIHANEQGFVFTNAEWFTGPPAWTRQRQAWASDVALARLMAAGHVRVSVFTCGGDSHPYGYLDAQGQETPAYRVVADYMALNGAGAQREDVALLPGSGGVLSGVYAAASRLVDGSHVMVLNPCEAPLAVTAVRLALRLPDQRLRRAQALRDGVATPVELRQDGAWAELALDLKGRTVLRLAP